MENYLELKITITMLMDVPMKNIQERFSELIAKTMLKDEEMKQLHIKNTFKLFSFCQPYPRELGDKIYHKGRLYCVHIRTLDFKFAMVMKNFITEGNSTIKVIAVELKNHEQQYISEIVNLTPIVSTLDDRYWLHEDGLALLGERLNSNLIRKKKKLEVDYQEQAELFYDFIEITNNKPIMIAYKKALIPGHKLRIGIKPDRFAQDLAFMALGVGLGEKNSQGWGYSISSRRG